MLFVDIAYLHPAQWQKTLEVEQKKAARVIDPKPIGRERDKAIQSMDEEENRVLHQVVNRSFDQATAESFQPNLRELDAAVRSLDLR